MLIYILIFILKFVNKNIVYVQYENIAPGDVCSPGYLYSTTLHSFSLPPKPFPAPGVYNPPKPFQAPGVYNPPSPLHSPPMSPGYLLHSSIIKQE